MGLSGTMQGAGGVGGLLKVTYYGGSTTNAFAAYDGNGNVMALVDASNGSVCARYEYGPFAEPIRVSGPMGKLNPVRFSSKYTDDESGFLYYGYRYYNPSTGRWPSRDPFSEAGSKNLVGFLNNDPLSHVDIMGFVPLVDVPWWPPPPPPKSAPTDPMRAAGYVPSPKRFKWEGVCPLTCCNEEQIKKGLNDLSEKYSAAVKAAAALGLRPASPYDPSNPASCKNSSLDIISWLMPTPPCWRCYLEHRDYNPSDVNDKWRDHQVIICISFGVLGNSKDQVMFDWWGDAKGRNNGGFTPHDPLPVREEYPYYAPTQPTSPDAYLDCQGMLHGRVPPKDFSASTARF